MHRTGKYSGILAFLLILTIAVFAEQPVAHAYFPSDTECGLLQEPAVCHSPFFVISQDVKHAPSTNNFQKLRFENSLFISAGTPQLFASAHFPSFIGDVPVGNSILKRNCILRI